MRENDDAQRIKTETLRETNEENDTDGNRWNESQRGKVSYAKKWVNAFRF